MHQVNVTLLARFVFLYSETTKFTTTNLVEKLR
jgi:hypothetical protein